MVTDISSKLNQDMVVKLYENINFIKCSGNLWRVVIEHQWKLVVTSETATMRLTVYDKKGHHENTFVYPTEHTEDNEPESFPSQVVLAKLNVTTPTKLRIRHDDGGEDPWKIDKAEFFFTFLTSL